MPTQNLAPSDLQQKLKEFGDWRLNQLVGDEKGESQIFLDRLLRSLGHDGMKEAGATLEFRVKRHNVGGTAFADMMWKPRCLIEMKKAGTALQKHYRQAFDYWVAAVPDRPRYVILCNFDEFWIYDFNSQLDEPVDRIQIAELPRKWEALAFLLPEQDKPQFGNDLVEVTREAAASVAHVFNSLQERRIDRPRAQQFTLQAVMAMFAEDIGLLPTHLFTGSLDQVLGMADPGDAAYDLVFGLLREMNTSGVTPAGRFKGTPYFNGGLFANTEPFYLKKSELEGLRKASSTNWAAVRPEIFGTLFEQSMDADERHAYGAHFTSQADIAKIVVPTIVTPWRTRIAEARTRGKGGIAAMERVLLDMSSFKVLDPAVGSGNFLYVAYRELRRLEYEALTAIAEMRNSPDIAAQGAFSYVSTDQFFGMDVNRFAVEVAKVTMMLGKKLSSDELADHQAVLPLENLDSTIVAADALFDPWPAADAIIGNPPYLGRRFMAAELGLAYIARLAERHPAVGGVSDFVSYWFPLAHDHLPEGGRAGFVATNSVRQNESREVSLDYIVDHDGVIYDAVSSQVWSGDAKVHVSIVNWVKGQGAPSEKVLWLNDGQLRLETDHISSSLSPSIDVRHARILAVNTKPAICFQGQTPGITENGYVISQATREMILVNEIRSEAVIYPYVGGREILRKLEIDRWIIDINEADLLQAKTAYPGAMTYLTTNVLPERERLLADEDEKNAAALLENVNHKPQTQHKFFLDRWWQLWRSRPEMLRALKGMDRYMVTSRLASKDRATVIEFVDSSIRPGDALTVFALDDDYSFGILSSSLHRTWLEARCSTFKSDWRYTPTTVWNTFSVAAVA